MFRILDSISEVVYNNRDFISKKPMAFPMCRKIFHKKELDTTVFEYLYHKVRTSYAILVADPAIDIMQAQVLNIHVADLDGSSPMLIGEDYCRGC